MPLDYIRLVVVVLFVITFLVTIWGLLKPGRIERRYMNALFGACILELAAAFFLIVNDINHGKVVTTPSTEQLYVFERATGEPVDLKISSGADTTLIAPGAPPLFKSIERQVELVETRDTLWIRSRQGAYLGYVRVADVLEVLNVSESLIPTEEPEKEAYLLGLYHGNLKDDKPSRDRELAALYMLQALHHGDETAYNDGREFYDRVRKKLVNALLNNAKLKAEDYELIVAATEQLGGNLTKGHDLGEIYLSYANQLDEHKYHDALDSFEEFLDKEDLVRHTIPASGEMIENARQHVEMLTQRLGRQE